MMGASCYHERQCVGVQAAFDVVMGRPCDRAPVLDMVLSTATAQDEDIRC